MNSLAQPQENWNEFNDFNRRDDFMAKSWVEPALQWVSANYGKHQDLALLDYGCGYFDLGLGLLEKAQRVDGFDPHEPSVAVSKTRVTGRGNCDVYSDPKDLKKNTYDVIFLNSVVQYFGTQDKFEEFLKNSQQLLRQDSKFKQIILADLIPTQYSAAMDALQNIAVAAKGGFLVAMLTHLVKTTLKWSDNTYFQVDFDQVKEIAERYGYAVERIPKNLTPSGRRYSVRLTYSPEATKQS